GSLQAQDEPDINAFVFVDKEPNPLNVNDIRGLIEYPAEAADAEIEGTVVARILVDNRGQYVRHKIVKEVHPALAAAVDAKLPALRFEPAMKGDTAMMYWVNVPFPFRLYSDAERAIRKNIDELTEQLEATPEDYVLWHKRGIQRSKIKAYDDALVDFDESLRLNPRKNKKKKKQSYEYLFYAHYGRAAVYAQKEQLKDAIADYSMAMQLAGEMKAFDSAVQATVPGIYLERGYIYALDSAYTEARTDLKWVLDNDTSQTCTAYPILADIALADDNKEELIFAYTGLIECRGEDDLLYYSRGYYRSEVGDYEGAVADLAIVAERSETQALKLAAHDRTAWCYLQQKNYAAAKDAIESAMFLNVLNPLAYFYRGQIKDAEGDQDGACEDTRKSLSFGLEGEDADEAKAYMEANCGGYEED
ncbi:MAG: energy transducer TonB, partial [Bacteroidota bacterium]